MSTDRERERERPFCNLVYVQPLVSGFGSVPKRLESARSDASLVRYASKIGYRVKQSQEHRQAKRGKETNYNSFTK